jgi:DNA-binding transcriptional ArsR family regulator
LLSPSATLDLTFEALGDPTRRKIVERLSRGPATVSELATPLDMTLAGVMQHLKVLETCGLTRSEKVGRVRTCSLETKMLRAAEDWFRSRREMWERSFDRLADYLGETDTQPNPDDPRTGG